MYTIESFSTVVILPIIIGVVKVLFAEEIRYFFALVFSYFWRPFDTDRNGKTHDWCMLHSSASGTWTRVSLLYKFNPFNGSSGVYVHRYDHNGALLHIERIRFADWAKMRKAVIASTKDLPVKEIEV